MKKAPVKGVFKLNPTRQVMKQGSAKARAAVVPKTRSKPKITKGMK